MMTISPIVTGSEEPGQTTRRTRVHSPVGDVAAGCAPAAIPYQSGATPYLRHRSVSYAAGLVAAPDLVARSTSTRSPPASQSCPTSALSALVTASSLTSY